MYFLRQTAKLPSQKVVLTVRNNKKQLIDLIPTELIYHKDMLNGKLVITDNDPVPIQINQGVVSRRDDMTITHEEADTMIIQQVASVGAANVLVVADDTDVFVLLCHFVFNGDSYYDRSVGGTWPYWLRHGRNIRRHWERCGTESAEIRNTTPLRSWRDDTLC